MRLFAGVIVFLMLGALSAFSETILFDQLDDDTPGKPPNKPDIGSYEQLSGAVEVAALSPGDQRLALESKAGSGAAVVYKPTKEPEDFEVCYLFRVDPNSKPSGANAYSQQLIFTPAGNNFDLYWGDGGDLFSRYSKGGTSSSLTTLPFNWKPGVDYLVQIAFDKGAGKYRITINSTHVVSDSTPFSYTSLRALAFSQNFPTSGVMYVDNASIKTTPSAAPSIQLKISGKHSVAHYPFSVLKPGKVIADISWRGKTEKLQAKLLGRRRPSLPDPTAPYAEVAGDSPLQLVYEVTASDVARGTNWRLVIEDPTGVCDAAIDVKLTLPVDDVLQAQFDKQKVSLRSGDFLPSTKLQDKFFNALPAAENGGLHGMIVLHRAITCDEIDLLERKGVLRQSFLNKRHSIGLIQRGVDLKDPEIARIVKWVLPLEPEDKIEPDLLLGNYSAFEVYQDGAPLGINTALNPDGTLKLLVQFYPDIHLKTIEKLLGTFAEKASPKSDHLWEVVLKATALVPLATNDAVEWIESGEPPRLLENATTRNTINVNAVQNATVNAGANTITYAGLSGNNITIGIDDAGVDEAHPDLNVVRNVSGGTTGNNCIAFHGSHVAGIAAGSGVQSANAGGTAFQWRGMAPRSGIVDWGTLVHAGNTLDAITNDSMDVVNHSHALQTDGDYSSNNRLIDQMVRGGAVSSGTIVPRIGRTFSAGNAGGNSAQFGNQFGYFATTKQMKNAVVVGNWNAGTNRLATGSSMGPAYDGRILPDVVAPGSGITSTNANLGYSVCGGTSMASPVVAGLHALLLEGWDTTYSAPIGVSIDTNPPLPSTLRAILIHTSTDIVNNNVRNAAHVEVDSDSNPANGNDGNGNPTATAGPDFATGWGLVNAQAAVNLLQDSRTVDGVPVPNQIVQDTVTQASVKEFEFVLDANGALRVTLAWDDIEAATQSPATNPLLINDLDLELVDPDGQVFYPWQLGQTILDADGDPIADIDQTPGTDIQVQIPINPTTTPASNSDYVPANALTGNGAWVAGTGKDHLNNVEQVFIQNAQAGRWRARVIGFDIPTGAQDFSLVGMPYPDLPELVGSNEDKVGIGGFNEDIVVDWNVANVGPVGTGGSFHYEVLLSHDFYLGGDIVLPIQSDSRPTDGLISSLGSGSSLDVSTTFRITSAQAASLLGIPSPSVTVQDLIDNDVFILIHIDAADAILEHEEPNIIPVQAARLVDVALVMDRSGSMGSSVPTSGGSQTKLQQLKKAANLFLDLMRKNQGDRLGEVSFSSSVTTEFDEPGAIEQVTPLTSGSGSNIAAAKAAVDGLSAGGGTNIRGGLQRGLDLLPAGSDRRKVIVFLSDGMKTSGGDPQQPSFLQQFTNQNVNVFSVGFGTEGASGNAGIDVDLLSALSNTGADGFFQVAENSTQLDKFFINALGGAIESELVVDPEGDLASGQTATVEAALGKQERAASFILTWDNPSANLQLYLRSPSGLLIYPGNISSFGDKVSLVSEPGYMFYKVNPPLPAGPSQDHSGAWEMIIHNTGGPTAHYMANVLADSTINLALSTKPPLGASTFTTGQSIGFHATFSRTGAAPMAKAHLTVYPTVPVAGLGDMLAANLITQEELAKIPTTLGDERLSMLERLGMAFQRKYGKPPVAKRAGVPFTLDLGDQGKDRAYFTGSFPTKTPGEYCFLVRAHAHDEDCDPVQREILRTVRVKPEVSRKLTRVDVVPTPRGYKVVVTPKDDLGHFVGPGHADAVEVKGKGVDQSGPVVDNLDGSYCVEITGTSGTLTLCVLGIELAPIVLEGDTPTPSVVTPSGGTNDGRTPIIVTVSGGTTGITSILLVGSSDPVALPVSKVNPDTGELFATVPAGLIPGNYLVQLVKDNKTGLPSGAAFKVIGKGSDFPDPVITLGDNVLNLLGNTDQKTGLLLLGDLLVQLRELPLGNAFDETWLKLAAEDVSKLLLKEQGIVEKGDILHLLEAVDRSKVDARDANHGKVNTPQGNQIEVDVSHNVKLIFNDVSKEGESEVKVLTGPDGFRDGPLGKVPAIFDIKTTAEFGDQGVMVEIEYEEGDYQDEGALILAHRKGNLWTDITTHRDPESNKICGLTESFSEFAVFEILPGDDAGEITGEAEPEGIDITTPDGRFYDIQFSGDMKSWITIAIGVSGVYRDTDPSRVNAPRQFYQAVLNQP